LARRVIAWICQEESPGCNETGFRLTDGRRKPRASATESRPPAQSRFCFGRVRVKRRCKRPPALLATKAAM